MQMGVATANKFVVGLIGAGIQGSLSPALHEVEAASQGIRLMYQLIDMTLLGVGLDGLGDLLLAAERMGFAGVNITYPAKQAVLPLLDELSPEAAALGAVNTVVFRAGRRIGHNTDAPGFGDSFRLGLPDVARDHVVQIGAGGAGSAVAHALLLAGVGHLHIFDRDGERATGLADALAHHHGAGRASPVTDLTAEVARANGLVQCTPVGMAKLPGSPIPLDLLQARHWLAEIIYFPLETELLAHANKLGCRTLPGIGMTTYQAAHAFRHFTGRDADAGRMRTHMTALVTQP